MFYNKNIYQRCFAYTKRYWYRNIKRIPLFFKLHYRLIKNGYDDWAAYDTFEWFIETMRHILKRYRTNRLGSPVVIENNPADPSMWHEINDKEWDKILDKMIELLDLMDEFNERYDADEYDSIEGRKKQYAEMCAARDEFFELFSKYFYCLWD